MYTICTRNHAICIYNLSESVPSILYNLSSDILLVHYNDVPI